MKDENKVWLPLFGFVLFTIVGQVLIILLLAWGVKTF